MNDPVISILIPSRKRTAALAGAIASFANTSPPDANYEILVRIDDDDSHSVSVLQDIKIIPKTTVIVGPSIATRTNDGAIRRELNMLYAELSAIARAPWIWIWNDDAWIRGDSWYQQICELKESPALVLTEHSQLHQSYYHGHAGDPFPIIPKDGWKYLGLKVPPEPIDFRMCMFAREANWPEIHLKNTCAVHLWRVGGGGLADD